MRFADSLRPRSLRTWVVGSLLALLAVGLIPKLWDAYQGEKLDAIQQIIEERSERREQQIADMQRKLDALAASIGRVEGGLERQNWPTPRRN